MSRTVRLVTLTLLLSLSLASGSHAAVSVAQPGLESFPSRLVELVVNFVWSNAKRGCGIDPYGRCLPQTTTSSNLEHGCGIDPTGGCLPQATTSSDLERGCQIDPYGRPVGSCQGD
ncbi:MAG TPA: hypothetical protein VLE27_05970 [Thermoanaerobaculia bacterium]|nr:hypothetical protein [Thermoanaerobaculia bacterium]